MGDKIIDDVNFINDGRNISFSFYESSGGKQISAGGVCIEAARTKQPSNILDWLGHPIEAGISGAGFQVKVGGQKVYPVASP